MLLPPLLLPGKREADACNSPNCNFKLQQPAVSSGSSAGSRQRFAGVSAGTTVSHQINNLPSSSVTATRSSSFPPPGIAITTASSSSNYHLPPTSARFQSLFRSDGAAAGHPVTFSRFHSIHSIAKETEVPPTTSSTYHRLNPLFEQTEGSFRSAYP